MSYILYNFFVSDILSLLVTKQEFKIETFQQLISRKDINLLVVKGSQVERIIQKVIVILNIFLKAF